ncbi:uncharacterized protein PITG_09121 [Phytophthora infestans T30-4]|uniref:Uncharacterized protein n=1 Tax=Phytophthora infestans (strain T30-4) TaxID=403677 RepID=D0NBR5_PHYIT|nr:uncharacterized protein PITG_09121 [Phytophthora infestans T30-4]EEY55220.1 conserved hypothetical protein [Phytophthora infestans T30-4]|eukprot:XP_002903444.1 conserved hypothetical protein [Phytophthora infestans T30-4]
MNRSQQGNTYSTICSKLCAVRWFHRNTAGYDPGVNASHAILLRGIRRFTNPVVKQQPLTARLLLAPKRAMVVGISLNGAKNNQFGCEEMRYHSKSKDPLICPVRAARWPALIRHDFPLILFE